jgi:hypothetical protein
VLLASAGFHVTKIVPVGRRGAPMTGTFSLMEATPV